ncbi:MAG: hypothetical protein HW396_571, partial [Candidatus Dadabacteria bacterium]|nr:hypothetical protein [Candidatus Dadabacteria bacterium]
IALPRYCRDTPWRISTSRYNRVAPEPVQNEVEGIRINGFNRHKTQER